MSMRLSEILVLLLVVSPAVLAQQPGALSPGDPVVRPDGRHAAVQLGIHGMGAGQGRGIVLIDLAAWERTPR